MSVRILNTPGGGYSTKDADAVPGDVKEGKIFYNKEGRKIGEGKFTQEKSIIPVNNIDPASYTLPSNTGCDLYNAVVDPIAAASVIQYKSVYCSEANYYGDKHSGTITSNIGVMNEDLLYITHLCINGTDYVMSIPIDTFISKFILFNFYVESSVHKENFMFSIGYNKWGDQTGGITGLFVENPNNYNIELFLTVGEILSN